MFDDEALDLGRMRRERAAKLQEQLDAQDVPALLLIGGSNVQYATGAAALTADASHVYLERPAALVVRGDPWPHLFTPYREGAPSDLPPDHVHPAFECESADGVAAMAGVLREI